jgi:replication factor A1
VHIRNAYAKKGFREGIEVSLGDYTVITAIDDIGAVKDENLSSGQGQGPGQVQGSGRVLTEKKVRELREGQSGVVVTGRILDVRERTVSTANGQKTLVEGELADETGRVSFSAWEPEKLGPEFKANAVVRVKSAYVKAFRSVPNLNLNQYTTIEFLPADTLPDAATLAQERPYSLGELEAAGGGDGVMVEGVLLEVKKGSGIIFRCGQPDEGRACTRVLQKMECRIHGKQKGTPDLRIKAVLDDGHGAATFFVGREPTERILGKSLAQAQEMARDAMTVDVIQDELIAKLTGRRVIVRGRATSDDFGLQILANDLEYAPEKDAQAEAEKLLGALDDVMREVA